MTASLVASLLSRCERRVPVAPSVPSLRSSHDGVALCALVAAAALAANGSVKKAKDFVEARRGTAEERRTMSAV